jgi:hypothetical protein
MRKAIYEGVHVNVWYRYWISSFNWSCYKW